MTSRRRLQPSRPWGRRARSRRRVFRRGTVPPRASAEDTLWLGAIGATARIQCASPEMRVLLAAHYRSMRVAVRAADVDYAIAQPNGCLRFARDGRAVDAADRGRLLFRFDQDLIVRLQELRRDLYFVHAAVLEREGGALMLVAESGGGKSTTVWALAHHGFRYLSDELAPVDLTTLTVYPYPRAVLLKNAPPPPYTVPRDTIRTSRGFHITTDALPGGVHSRPVPLSVICFVRYVPTAMAPWIRRISAARGGARLYVNALNPLAHPGDGLDAAMRIASRTLCFELATADLADSCAVVTTTVAAALRGPAGGGAS